MIVLLAAFAWAEEVGQALLVEGSCVLERTGVAQPLLVGASIDRADTVAVGVDSSVLVVLTNQHVVQLEADERYVVAELVMLDAPPTSVDIAAQLDSLAPDVSVPPEGFERIAGWLAIRTAGDAVGRGQYMAVHPAPPPGKVSVPVPPPRPPPLEPDEKTSSVEAGLLEQPSVDVGSTCGTDDGLVTVVVRKGVIRRVLRSRCARALLLGRPTDLADGRHRVPVQP